MPETCPIKFALATFNAAEVVMLATNTSLFDVNVDTPVPIIADVPLLKMLTPSVLAVAVLNPKSPEPNTNLFTRAT